MLRRKHTTSQSDGLSSSQPDDDRHHPNVHPSGKSKPFVSRPLLTTLLGCCFFLGLGVYIRNYRIQSRNNSQQYLATSGQVVLPFSVSKDKEKSVELPLKNSPLRKVSQKQSVELTREEDEALLITSDGTDLHVIFSTDCGGFQHWQSYLFFYQAMKVRQPGRVTRIASGCSESEIAKEQKWFDEYIAPLSNRFGLHFTPQYNLVKADDGSVKNYKFFNKPFGLRHWMEHGTHLGLNSDGKTVHNEGTVVILLDPDMILLRPVTHDFSNERESIVSKFKRDGEEATMLVTHGKPFAQRYGMGEQWRRFNLTAIAGADSPAHLVTAPDGRGFYQVGPPYLATARDMYQISLQWTEFARPVHLQYPHLLAEMFAYCIAAAHLQLPHQMIESLMISNVGSPGEGWPFVDAIETAEETCPFAMEPNHDRYPLPTVIHYCQRYLVGSSFFAKRKMPHDFFTCESPLILEPQSDLATLDFALSMEIFEQKDPLDKKRAKRDAYMICAIVAALNNASLYFKEKHCKNPNTQKSLDLHSKPKPKFNLFNIKK